MSDSLFPPFLKWGNYRSKDKENPDIIRIKVKETDTHESEFSINVVADVWQEDEWVEMTIPLKSHDSRNSSLFNQWSKMQASLKKGQELIIKTCLGVSKNGRPIRRFSLEKPS